jgi:type I restriction enzyme R subunit
MAHVCTKGHLVEQPAVQPFAELGWQVAEPDQTGLFYRETKAEVVLEPRLRAALERPNTTRLTEVISIAVDVLTRDRSVMNLTGANREIYELLKDGATVSVTDRERVRTEDRVRGGARLAESSCE